MILKDFNKFKFDVIDVRNTSLPAMTISHRSIYINQACIEAMGSPEHLRFLLDAEHKVFAVQACKDSENKGGFYKCKNSRGGYSGSGKTLRRIIRNMMTDSWRSDRRYRLQGVVFAANQAVAFDLNSATELPLLADMENEGKSE